MSGIAFGRVADASGKPFSREKTQMSNDHLITEADRELHRRMGGTYSLDDIAAFKAKQTRVSAMAAGATAPGLSPEDMEICRQMGLDPERYAAELASARASVAQIPAHRREEVATMAGGHWNVVAMASCARRLGLVF